MSPAPAWPLPHPAFPTPAARREAVAGKVAVVTGASRGLGAGIASHLAAAGLHLGLCARHRPDLVASTRPRALEGRVEPPEAPLTASVDVTDHRALSRFADAVIERFGRIDLWINNAGVLEPIGPVAEASPEELERHVAVNLTAVLCASGLFARHVRARTGDGVLVNISSGAASSVYRGWAPYGATKAAVDRLSTVMAAEEREHGLRVHAVAPGVVDTDMQALIRATDERRFPAVDRFRRLKDEGGFNSATWVAEHLLELAFAGADVPDAVLRVPPEPAASGSR